MRSLIFVVALTALLSVSVLAQTSCPGPALQEKPGSELSLETQFFSELARLDGVLADGQILQGCLLDERVQFEIETGRGPQTWEAALGEVVGYLPALGDEPRVLLFVDGAFELRTGRLHSPLTLRFGESREIRMEPERVEFFVLRGVYQKLPLTAQARLLSQAIVSFQQLRTRAELIAMRTAGVFSGEVLTQDFSIQLRSGETRRFVKRELGQLTVLRSEGQGVYAQIYLRSGQLVEGVVRTATLQVWAWGQSGDLLLRDVRQIVFQNETLRFGGGGRVQLCPEEPC